MHNEIDVTDDLMKRYFPRFRHQFFTDKKSQQRNVLHKSCTMLSEVEAMGAVMPGLSTCTRHGPNFGERTLFLRSKLVRIRIL